MTNTPARPEDAIRFTAGRDLGARRLSHVMRTGFGDPEAGGGRRREHSALLDAMLRDLARDAGLPDHGVGLLALGSLGRREIGPASDLDLMLLHDGTLSEDAVARMADALWYPLWDSGTSLDHSVRTPRQVADVALADFTAAIDLLDGRLVAGDEELAASTLTTVRNRWRIASRTRLPELIDHALRRGEIHGRLAYSSEPDLKNGRGGLRDIVTIRALAATWLADYDHPLVAGAAGVLLDARDALQAVTGSTRPVLLREHQETVAAMAGAEDGDDLLVRVAGAGRTVMGQLEAMLRALDGSPLIHGRDMTGFGVDRRPRRLAVGPGLVRYGREVSIPPDRAGVGGRLLFLRAAAYAARHHLALTQGTLDLRVEAEAGGAFTAAERDALVDLLATGEGLIPIHEQLDLAGLVTRWIPYWDGVRNWPQHSEIHEYTVDRHQIQTVVELSAHLHETDRPDLLLVTGLLHDLGKRRGQRDHAAEGAPLAEEAARALGFDAADAALVRTLVAQHLTLVNFATTRDPYDDGTVAQLLDVTGHDERVLGLLRLLTEADARAAGPRAWTSWRERLVSLLTDRARARLHVLESSEPHGVEEESAFALTGSGDRLRSVAAEVAETGHVHLSFDDLDYSDLAARTLPVAVTIGAPDATGLVAAMARALARHRLATTTALISTVDGVAVDTWWVRPERGILPAAEALRRTVELEIAAGLPEGKETTDEEWRTSAGGEVPVVTLLPGASRNATVIQVNAPDRSSLLADVAAALARDGVSVRSAHIGTRGPRAIDVLYVVDSSTGLPLRAVRIGTVIATLMDAARPS